MVVTVNSLTIDEDARITAASHVDGGDYEFQWVSETALRGMPHEDEPSPQALATALAVMQLYGASAIDGSVSLPQTVTV